MIIFNSNKSGLEVIGDNSLDAKFEELCQNLLLWQGENPMDSENGIDYFGVLEGSVYLPAAVETITANYAEYFESIDLKDFEITNDGFIKLTIEVASKEKIYARSLEVS